METHIVRIEPLASFVTESSASFEIKDYKISSTRAVPFDLPKNEMTDFEGKW
jgi:hypothetical protein